MNLTVRPGLAYGECLHGELKLSDVCGRKFKGYVPYAAVAIRVFHAGLTGILAEAETDARSEFCSHDAANDLPVIANERNMLERFFDEIREYAVVVKIAAVEGVGQVFHVQNQTALEILDDLRTGVIINRKCNTVTLAGHEFIHDFLLDGYAEGVLRGNWFNFIVVFVCSHTLIVCYSTKIINRCASLCHTLKNFSEKEVPCRPGLGDALYMADCSVIGVVHCAVIFNVAKRAVVTVLHRSVITNVADG